MNGENRTSLEKAICRYYNLEHLISIFHLAFREKLETHVFVGSKLETVVFDLINWLENDDRNLKIFLLLLKEHTPWPELRSIIYTCLNIPIPNPYEVLVAYGEPIVDRKGIKVQLRQLFYRQQDGSYFSQALITRGPRYSGRSYAKWLIQAVTSHENIQKILIDLLDNTYKDIISDLKSEMSLPQDNLSDSEAQPARQIKNFLSALGGYLRNQAIRSPASVTSWCLVFDHYDLVEPEAKVLVDQLVQYATDRPELNLWVIVLGHDNQQAFQGNNRVLVADLEPITKKDVENFVDEAKKEGIILEDATCDEVFTLLEPIPLDLERMRTMNSRLRACYTSFLL